MTERAEQLESSIFAPASRRRGWLLVSLLLAGGMVAWVVAWLLGTDMGTQRQRLPDGSTVSLLGYTYGQKHEFLTGPRWQKLLWPIVSRTWRDRLSQVTLIERKQFPPKSLVLWIRQRPETPDLMLRRLITAEDDHGCRLNAEIPDLYGTTGTGGELACPLSVDAFSRRGRTVRVRMDVKNARGGWDRGAEFTIPNPDPGPHPVWQAAPLPTSHTVDGLTFMLMHFDTRVPRHLRPGPLPPAEYPCSRISYRVLRNGVVQPNWYVSGLSLADATSNAWTPRMTTGNGAGYSGPGNVKRYEFHGEVCPHEAYKVRVEFTNDREFASRDRWIINNLVLPQRGASRDPRLTTQRGPVRMTLRAICGPAGEPPGLEFFHLSREEMPVQVIITPKELASGRVQLLRAADQRGRNLLPDNRPYLLQGDSLTESGSEIVFGLRPLPGIRSVNLTFGIRRSYFVDFVVRPVRAADEAPRPR